MRTLNVVVADDHPIFVAGLQAVLSRPSAKFSCRINGVARSGAQVTEMLEHSDADLLVIDLNLPETDSLKIIPSLKKGHRQTRVLVMTSFDDPRLVKAAFKAGVDGYILKSGTQDELLNAIEAVVEGHTFLGTGVNLTSQLQGHNGNGQNPLLEGHFARKYGLTRREIEIMHYIGQALNNKEIAEKLYISDQTVSVHRKNIMRKLSVNNTASLIRIAYENNLV